MSAPAAWWTEPTTLAALVRHMWLLGVIDSVEDALSILDRPWLWESEYERMNTVLA